MTTNNVFPLLDLPAGVETHLLPFVASGTGGLQALLSLRSVCKTTKSWIDTLPLEQGKSLFSKAQVRMDSDVDTVKRCVETAPPFKVNSLSLNIKEVLDKNPRAEEEELWNEFCANWAPRLETLELRNEDQDYDDDDTFSIFNDNRRILNLMESPNLQVLRLGDICVTWNILTPIPSSTFKVTELSINFSSSNRFSKNGEVKRFYSELMKNPNLRKLETWLHDVTDFECLQNFIDARKEDKQLKMTLHLDDLFPPEEDEDDEDTSVYLKFANSVVASKSTIRLRFLNEYNLENAKDFLPLHIAMEMFEKIELLEIWNPDEETLALLDNLRQLKEVKVETEIYDDSVERRINELTFPPSLENLSFTKGFPAIGNLPEALKSLTLEDFACNVTELLNSMTSLKTQCVGLETLNVSWKCESTKSLAQNFEKSSGFANLRSLTFKCDIDEMGVEITRAVLVRGFQLETLQLQHLALRFQLRGQKDVEVSVPVVVLDAPFLTRLCEGPVGNFLLMCDIEKESVTPGGLPPLERLTSLAAANTKSREEREGRGPWQRQWKIIAQPKPKPERDFTNILIGGLRSC